jgi:pimeloyl-ACP methyl ester carboxylesterase
MHVVLIHGGAHGAWCWDGVRGHLAERGIASTSHDLPGSGADATPRNEVTLTSYIAATNKVVDAIDDEIVLVGHSLAGMTMPAVAAAQPAKVRRMIFLAALLTRTGEFGIGAIPEDRRASYYALAASSSDNSLLPDFPTARERFFASLPEAAARACYNKLTPQPFGPDLQPQPVGIDATAVPRDYILLQQDMTFPPLHARKFAALAGVDPVVRVGDHCWMLTAPRDCATTIADLSRSSASL